MSDIEKVIEVANKYVGYKEGKNNDTIFGKYTGTPNQPYCASFVCYVFNEAGLGNKLYGGKKFASCTALMNYHKGKGQVITSGYRRGDILLYQFDKDPYADHIGIMIGEKNGKCVAIEGNTSIAGSQDNGDGVYIKERSPKLIMCAIRWTEKENIKVVKKEDRSISITIKQIQKGSEGNSVNALQVLLNSNGAKLNVDGKFGSLTDKALRAYQAKVKLKDDGVCGKNTWQSLLC